MKYAVILWAWCVFKWPVDIYVIYLKPPLHIFGSNSVVTSGEPKVINGECTPCSNCTCDKIVLFRTILLYTADATCKKLS